eukprot:m.75815 g.75815  ORF g.75815 m.75815 type:complete len:413 (-) comp24830_c0_seq1:257-1495(-)
MDSKAARSSSRQQKRKKFDDEVVETLSKKPPSQSNSATMSGLHNRKKPVLVEGLLPSASSDTDDFTSMHWTPEDDYRLILNVQQVPDLYTISKSVKFTKQYTLREIKEHWYMLLYHLTTSRLSNAGIAMISESVKRSIATDGLLYSADEENELRAIQPVNDGTPAAAAFQKLLHRMPEKFHWGRTPASLQIHWSRLKQHGLLAIDKSCGRWGRLMEQRIELQQFSTNDSVDFGVISAQLTTEAAPIEDATLERKIERELEGVDRKHKRKIRKLELQISLWKNVHELGFAENNEEGSFDRCTLAILRGKTTCFKMRSQEILLGRNAEGHSVDIDLTVEDKGNQISRSQCIIKLKPDRHFYLTNLGKRPTYVNAQPVLRGARCRLLSNSIIEVCSARLLFTINDELMRALRMEL